jgi:hypothetical protein
MNGSRVIGASEQHYLTSSLISVIDYMVSERRTLYIGRPTSTAMHQNHYLERVSAVTELRRRVTDEESFMMTHPSTWVTDLLRVDRL